MSLSIIIPIHPDETDSLIESCIYNVNNNCMNYDNIFEIILVSSKDLSKFKDNNKKIKILSDPKFSTRSKAMNNGFLKMKKKNIAVFLHIDTILPKNFDNLILEKMKIDDFCFFFLKFDNNHIALKTIEFQVNNIRNFPYGDQCFCIKYDFHLKYNMFDDLPFMEDYQYILKIPKSNRNNCINDYVITSARRYKNKDGFSFRSISNNVLNNKNLINLYNKNENIFKLEKNYYKNGLLGYYYYD